MKHIARCSAGAGRTFVALVIGVVLLVALSVQVPSAWPQSKPLDRSRVMALTVRTGDANGEISSQIKQAGITFVPTAEDLQAFRDAGARETLLNTLQNSKVVPPPEKAIIENQLVFRHLSYGAAKSSLCSQVSGSKNDPDPCQEAEHEMRAAIAEDPQSASAHYALGALLLGWVYVRGLSPAAAESPLREAVRLEPDFFQAHGLLGHALGMAGDIDSAIAEFHECIRLSPDDEGAHFELLQILEKNKGAAESIQLVKEFIRNEPTNAAYHFDLVQLYRGAGNLDGVIAECNEAIRLNPNDSVYHFVLGHALLDGKGDPAAAIPHFREAVRLGDKLEPGTNRYNLGIALVANMSYDEALVELRETRRVFPIPGVTQYIAAALLGKGDVKEAVEELRPLIADVPHWPLPHALLAVAYARLGTFTEAIKECSEARKLAGKDDASDIKAMCDEIETRVKKSK